MNYNYYLPEGSILRTQENLSYISSLSGLERAMREDRILESTALMCDEDFNLHVDLFGIKGIIPRSECLYVPDGESIKDIAIITRVGKPVCFKVNSIERDGEGYRAILSRRDAQIECRSYYLSSLISGDIIPATVTHLDTFGAFLDIGCGIPSLLSIDSISISRISHPSDRLNIGQRMHVIVKSNNISTGRIFVTLKELLGTWLENASEFAVGQTVSGIVRSIENYGVFVELRPNLAGLAELKCEHPILSNIKIGDRVSVYVKSIIPERLKIKLVLIDRSDDPQCTTPLRYYINTSSKKHIDRWVYSPDSCSKRIESIFE